MRTDFSQAQVAIDYDHNKVHEGQMFSISEIAVSISASGVQYYLISTGSKSLHVRPARITSSADSLKYEVFSGTNYSGGSALTPLNRNTLCKNAPLSVFTKSPTGTTEGTRITGDYLPGSTGQGQTRAGDASSDQNELILAPNTVTLIKFSNGSSGANLVTFSYMFYEI